MNTLILIVEDDEANAEVLMLLIAQELPCRVLWVSNGEEAFQIAAKNRPDLLVLDYLLPGMNGLEVYDRLHMLPGWEAIPVLLVSASTNRETIESCHLPFLEKPFDADDLLALLRRLLGL